MPTLREDQWSWHDSIRYTAACDTIHGTSGSPIVDLASNQIVGINNTGNDDGQQCTLNNPCEVDANGNITVHQGQSYGQQTYWFNTCLTSANAIDLTKPGCLLTKPAGQGNTVTVTNPGAQTATVGTPVSLQISARSSGSGQTLTYSATGLPAGLSINASSGLITGTPSTPANRDNHGDRAGHHRRDRNGDVQRGPSIPPVAATAPGRSWPTRASSRGPRRGPRRPA